MTNVATLPTRANLVELAPLVRRAARLDPGTLVRIRLESRTVTGFVLLPFGVLAGRSVPLDHTPPAVDSTYRAGELIDWIDVGNGAAPAPRDGDWRGGLPPSANWRKLEVIPDEVIRGLVRSGAATLKEAAAREGVPDAQPRAEVADVLLDSIVLTVSGDAGPPALAEVSLRMVSALTRMGFLPTDSRATIDLAGRWLRVAGKYGSIYTERPGVGLKLA
jgi:hypothetical protein